MRVSWQLRLQTNQKHCVKIRTLFETCSPTDLGVPHAQSNRVFWNLRQWLAIFIAMSEVTRILSEIEEGDPQASEKLLSLVYDELRKLAAVKLAQEKPGQTLQA